MNADNGELFELFLEGVELRRGSANNYSWLLGLLDGFLGGKGFRDVSEDEMRRFAHLHKGRLEVST